MIATTIRSTIEIIEKLEASEGIEPPYKDLQSMYDRRPITTTSAKITD